MKKPRTRATIELSCECGRNHKVAFSNAGEDDVAGKVIAEVAKATGIATKAILGPSQVARIARARGIVMARLREHHGWTYARIAAAVNRTAWAHCKSVCERYKGQ